MNRFRAVFLLVFALLLQGCWHDDNDTVVAVPLETGEIRLDSSGVERSFYLIVPADYDASQAARPLLFAYHGTSGTYDLWLNGYYDLVDAVGDQAITVLMQALPDQNGVTQWSYPDDLQYFQDVFAYLDEHMTFDKRRVFVTGHSSGGGMAHELGCKFGNLIRGIAPYSGIMRSTECVGAVAVFQTHGAWDTLVPAGSGEGAHNFWTLYNGFDPDLTIEGMLPFCVDHALVDSPYPVQWCLHEEGEGHEAHNWPSFASAATWEFFSSLSPETPGMEPPSGGGNSKVANLVDTTLSFTLRYPAGIGTVTQGSIGLYAAGSQQPLAGGPSSILRLAFDPESVGPGVEKSYVVPIKYSTETFPGTYAVAILMYVANGGNPIPYVGRDLIALTDVELIDRNTPVVIDTPLLLEKVHY